MVNNANNQYIMYNMRKGVSLETCIIVYYIIRYALQLNICMHICTAVKYGVNIPTQTCTYYTRMSSPRLQRVGVCTYYVIILLQPCFDIGKIKTN